MTELPMPFRPEMVRAILAGRKTQTRRLVKGRALDWLQPGMFEPEYVALPGNGMSPHGYPGDRWWIRETWQRRDDMGVVLFRADLDDCGQCPATLEGESEPVWLTPKGPWQPGMHLRHVDARPLRPEVVAVRIERLQSISEEDATAEGLGQGIIKHGWQPKEQAVVWSSAVGRFRLLWDSINGKRAPWDSNPWVWVLDFRPVPSGL